MTILPATKTSHVAVIAFPFTSHPISLHSLVVRLARSSPNIHFTFLNTPTSNASLFKSPANGNPNTLPPNLKPYDLDDGIPPGVTASDLSLGKATELFYGALLRPGSLKAALDAAALAAGAEITCLLVDAVLSLFLADAIEEELLGRIPWVAVWSPSPCALSAYVHTKLIRQHCAAAAAAGKDVGDVALDFVPGLSNMRVSDHWPRQIVLGELNREYRFLHGLASLGQALPRASAVVLNSFRELNHDELNRDMDSKFRTVLNIGFFTVSIPPPPPSDSDSCLAWLDGQKPHSVAYICFGTAAELSENEIAATAEALEETDISFLWSLPDHQKKLLPKGFVERTQLHGKIVAWTNQVQVLRHGSVGVHVTHCGYNSVNESIVNGVPIIARPFWADNTMNAKMAESVWKIGVRVDDEGGVLTKSGFVKALEMVLKQEEGKKMREQALALKKVVFEGSSPSGSGTKDFNALLRLLSNV